MFFHQWFDCTFWIVFEDLTSTLPDDDQYLLRCSFSGWCPLKNQCFACFVDHAPSELQKHFDFLEPLVFKTRNPWFFNGHHPGKELKPKQILVIPFPCMVNVRSSKSIQKSTIRSLVKKASKSSPNPSWVVIAGTLRTPQTIWFFRDPGL